MGGLQKAHLRMADGKSGDRGFFFSQILRRNVGVSERWDLPESASGDPIHTCLVIACSLMVVSNSLGYTYNSPPLSCVFNMFPK